LLHSQYGINPFDTKIKINVITKLIISAIEKEMEDKLFQQWLIDYGRMDKETFISFENYKSKSFKKGNDNKLDVKEILEKAEAIKKLDQKNKKRILK